MPKQKHLVNHTAKSIGLNTYTYSPVLLCLHSDSRLEPRSSGEGEIMPRIRHRILAKRPLPRKKSCQRTVCRITSCVQHEASASVISRPSPTAGLIHIERRRVVSEMNSGVRKPDIVAVGCQTGGRTTEGKEDEGGGWREGPSFGAVFHPGSVF